MTFPKMNGDSRPQEVTTWLKPYRYTNGFTTGDVVSDINLTVQQRIPENDADEFLDQFFRAECFDEES